MAGSTRRVGVVVEVRDAVGDRAVEERERAVAQRVGALREEADRVLAELRDAELDWERFAISQETVLEVLAGPDGAAKADAPVPADPELSPLPSGGGAVPGSVVPGWGEGLVVSVLSPEYQRIVRIWRLLRRR
ncbi:hypothetical protein [Streptomyces sp. NPDC056663]|uniref:hypothetical protein n=1 Tax=Streptomyces sp. NPDC056663 TaxID=3345899 RepID=UPI0036A24855